MAMQFGKLSFEPALEHLDLVAESTKSLLRTSNLSGVLVSAIDASVSDTAAFCERYNILPATAANCVIVSAKRGDQQWYAACMVLATTKADVNGTVRRQLDARKVSFAPMETAIALTNMEYGGITPLGLPTDWPILIDTAVASAPWVIIGSGIRASKLLVPGNLFHQLSATTILDIAKTS